MATLRDLEAKFIRYEAGVAHKGHGRHLPDGTIQWGGFPVDTFVQVETLAEAQGLWFLCPACYAKNGGNVGTHGVRVFFHGRGVPDRGVDGEVLGKNEAGQPVRWTVVAGTGLDDLQLSPSILLQGGGCQWHGFVGSSGVAPGHAQ